MKHNIETIIQNLTFALRFGRGFFAQLHVAFVTFLFPLEHFLHFKREKSIPLNLVFNKKSFSFYVRDSSDIAVLKEVFLFSEYHLELEKDPDVIVDLGSNVGASVAYFALRYPEAHILAVEADPVTTTFLEENTKQFPFVSVRNYAVSDTGGTLTFYVHPESRMSSSLVRRARNQEAIQVPAIKFTELLSREKISRVDVLKFDIEGAEVKAFSKEGTLDTVDHLVGEIHLDLVGVPEEDVWRCFQNFFYTIEQLSQFRSIIEGKRKN